MSRSSPASAAGPGRSSRPASTRATRPRPWASSTRSATCRGGPTREGGSMSSPCRAEAVLMLALALAGCARETRDNRGNAMAENPRGPAFEGNAYHIAQGQRLYGWMNCGGCHSNGGGGMGPPLMDDEWRYGSLPNQIFATIAEGRANGMPAWKYRLTTQQIWQLVAYVRSLSGLTPKSARPGREDHMMVKPAPMQTPNAKAKNTGLPGASQRP